MLPRYSGTFEVGVIDLELPVREPRSFASKAVPITKINASRAERKKAAAATKGQTEEEQDSDDEADEWDPFKVKAKTCTLHLSTVLFSIYYPSSITKKEAKSYDKAAWLGRPKHRAMQGLLSYLGQYGAPLAIPASPALLYLAAAKMKARCAPPLASPDDPRTSAPPPFSRHHTGLFGDEPRRFPVVVFSHGLAGSRLSYSQFCGELASYGIIVAALEHRDGSGVRSTVRVPQMPPSGKSEQNSQATTASSAKEARTDAPTPPAKSSTYPGVQEQQQSSEPDAAQTQNKPGRTHPRKADVPYLVYETLGLRPFATDPTDEEVGLRQAQLAMRAAELEECLHVLKRIERGEGDRVAAESTRGLANKLSSGVAKRQRRKQRGTEARDDMASLEGAPERLKDWHGKLDVESPALVGHSFGGATVLEAARTEDESPPWLAIFSLDPWMDPIVEENRSSNRIPTYCLNSEAFTVWEENFDKLKRVLHAAREANSEHRGWLMTLAGSNHLDFSDYPFLLPHLFRSTIGPVSTVGVFTRAVLVEFGLLRQRHRERSGKPGFKAEGVRAAGKDPKLGSAGSAEHEKPRLNEQGNALGSVPTKPEAEAILPEALQSITSARGQSQGEASQDAEASPDKHSHLLDKILPHVDLHLHNHTEDAAPHGVIAKRTESGANLIGVPRTSAEAADFSVVVADIVDADRDAETVHASLEDISASLAHNNPKVHSLMGLMLRMYGISPGIAQPGSIVVHSVP